MIITPGKKSVLITGKHKSASSIVVCFLQAGYAVTFQSENVEDAANAIAFLRESSPAGTASSEAHLTITENIPSGSQYDLAIAAIAEKTEEKKAAIERLEAYVSQNGILAINTESIPLTVLQAYATQPEKVIGANWSEPAHTTYFLEIITNKINKRETVDTFLKEAKDHLRKDPYLIEGEVSIRAKLLAALTREAFFLVENGYASTSDIDRACRNDAGYYLPFSGNCRYMDLTGTDAYGRVMKDLNPELSNASSTPAFFNTIMENNALGMENDKGFYEYETGKTEEWNNLMNTFSHQIRALIDKYPFNYENQD